MEGRLSFKILFISFFVLSCARVNRESREYYKEKHSYRHGIVPVERPAGNRTAMVLDQKAVQRGKKLYSSHCISCHGEEGKGDGPLSTKQLPRPKNLQQLAKNVPDFRFFMMASKWSGSMPGWKSTFSSRDLKDLEQYLRSLSL